MTDHPCKGLSKACRNAFERIAVNEPPQCKWSVLDKLMAAGLIIEENLVELERAKQVQMRAISIARKINFRHDPPPAASERSDDIDHIAEHLRRHGINIFIGMDLGKSDT